MATKQHILSTSVAMWWHFLWGEGEGGGTGHGVRGRQKLKLRQDYIHQFGIYFKANKEWNVVSTHTLKLLNRNQHSLAAWRLSEGLHVHRLTFHVAVIGEYSSVHTDTKPAEREGQSLRWTPPENLCTSQNREGTLLLLLLFVVVIYFAHVHAHVHAHRLKERKKKKNLP